MQLQATQKITFDIKVQFVVALPLTNYINSSACGAHWVAVCGGRMKLIKLVWDVQLYVCVSLIAFVRQFFGDKNASGKSHVLPNFFPQTNEKRKKKIKPSAKYFIRYGCTVLLLLFSCISKKKSR